MAVKTVPAHVFDLCDTCLQKVSIAINAVKEEPS